MPKLLHISLAGYCQKAGLAEEGCVARTLHMRSFKSLSEDLVRKIFRNTYKKPYNGKTLSQMNEKERIMRSEHYTMTPRLCSFIATTNDLTPLPSGDGTRRYLCIEVTRKVDIVEKGAG